MSASFVYLDENNNLSTTNSTLSGLFPTGTALTVDLEFENKFSFGTEASNDITVGNTLIKEIDIISENLNISGNVEVTQNINVTDRLVSNILQVKDKLLDSNEAEGTIGKILVSTSTGKLEWGDAPINIDLTTSTELGTNVPDGSDNIIIGNTLIKEVDIISKNLNISGNVEVAQNINVTDTLVSNKLQVKDKLLDSNGVEGTSGQTLKSTSSGKLEWGDASINIDLTTSTELGTNVANGSITIGKSTTTERSMLTLYGSSVNLWANSMDGIVLVSQAPGGNEAFRLFGTDSSNSLKCLLSVTNGLAANEYPYLSIMDVTGSINTPSKTLTTDVNGKLLWADGGGSSSWTTNGSNIYIASTTSKVGIGIVAPTQPLDVNGCTQSSTSIIKNETVSANCPYPAVVWPNYNGELTIIKKLDIYHRDWGSSVMFKGIWDGDAPDSDSKATGYPWKMGEIRATDPGGGWGGNLIFKTKPMGTASTDLQQVMILDYQQRVGIRTTDPGFPLEVAGHTISSGTHYYYQEGGSMGWYTFASNAFITAKFHGMIWLQSNVLISSDRRIKTNIVDVPDNLALQQLRSIPCRYYEYIDKFKRGNDKTIGFIAQEVKTVLPMAVTINKGYIPDIYKSINCTWTSNTEGFNMSSTDLTNVSGIKYRFYVSNDSTSGEEEINVLGNNDNTFTFEKQWLNVFCYGKEVDDFNTLDKSKLFTLNFSATQEIDRIQQQHITEIAALKQENLQQQNEINTLKNELSQIKNILLSNNIS